MKRLAAAHFKARCLRLMEEVRRKREPILITKKGVPVAKLVPVDERPRDIFGCMAGTARILGDITQPLTRPEAWEALR